jgi:hypothetical protein
MSGQPSGRSVVHATKPLIGLVVKEINGPLHFMFDENNLFIPTIAKCFCAEPIDPIDYC